MATPWALTPLKPAFQSAFQPLGTSAATGTGLQNAYRPPTTTSYTIAPVSKPNTTYQSSGTTFAPQPASTTARSNAISTLGSTGQGGNYQPNPTTTRSPYSQPTGGSPAASTSSQAAPARSGALTGPGAYEQWYQQNASRYNQPTALSSYWQSVQGRVQGQRFQPTTARDAYGRMSDAYAKPGQGMTNAWDVANQMRSPTRGEGVMNAATSFFSGPNNTAQFYGDNRSFFESPGAIEDYFAANGDRFQQAGFGEKNAQGILQDPSLTGLYGKRLVGDELDYFRDPLRQQSYSEKLYESGNEGLNQWYDLQRQRQQEDLENQMSAMGVFGSGETAEAMYRMREGLAAEQARDMAGLAGQADAERRARADLLFGAAGSAAQEELGRGGLMLDAGSLGLQLDRDAISRLYQGGQLADASSRYGLDRVMSGGQLARSADESLFQQGTGLAGIGRDMSDTEIRRLESSGRLGLDADAEERGRLSDLFGAGRDVDQLGLSAQAADLDWIMGGAQIAGNVDRGNLDWINAEGGAADRAQERFETRERYGFTDPFAAASGMGGMYGGMSSSGTEEQTAMRTEAVNLLLQQGGISVQEAERRASEWMANGTLLLQLAALRGQR